MNNLPEERCELCGYALKYIQMTSYPAIKCRRYPPVPMVVYEDSEEGSVVWTEWPHVKRDDWCGEYKHKMYVHGED